MNGSHFGTTNTVLLLFGNFIPLPMKDTTPERVMLFNIHCGRTTMPPFGLNGSVGTPSITCKKIECSSYRKSQLE